MTRNIIYVFIAMMSNCFMAIGCNCIENNQTLNELDEYSLMNAQLAVWMETGDAVSDGEYIVLKAKIVSQIKKTDVKIIYLKGKDEKDFGFELSQMANKKLVYIEVGFVGDTVLVNHCKQLWVWHEDPNKIRKAPDYFKIMQRQYAVASFINKSMLQGHNTIQYTNMQNTTLGKFKDDLPQGLWVHFNYYGGAFAKGKYVAGVKEGPWIESYYKQKKNGNKIFLHKMGYAKGNYVNGVRDGKWTILNRSIGTEVIYYRNGEIFEKM